MRVYRITPSSSYANRMTLQPKDIMKLLIAKNHGDYRLEY